MDNVIWFFMISATSAAFAITLGASLFLDCMSERRNSKTSHTKL